MSCSACCANTPDYAPDVLNRLHFVIVDDCSPLRFEIPDLDLNMTWLRITDDILWNQPGARNLGAVYAKSDKILLCDLDYEFPEHTLRHMIARRNPGKNFYQFRHHDGKKHGRSGHGNNFLVSRARFLRLYGYDEEYAGAYGEEDYRLVNFFKYHGTWKKYLPRKYYFAYNERINRDKSWHTLVRDGAHNARLDCRKHSELLVWGAEAGHSRMFLNFKWEVVPSEISATRAAPRARSAATGKKCGGFARCFAVTTDAPLQSPQSAAAHAAACRKCPRRAQTPARARATPRARIPKVRATLS